MNAKINLGHLHVSKVKKKLHWICDEIRKQSRPHIRCRDRELIKTRLKAMNSGQKRTKKSAALFASYCNCKPKQTLQFSHSFRITVSAKNSPLFINSQIFGSLHLYSAIFQHNNNIHISIPLS